jgi:hypothetical protein
LFNCHLIPGINFPPVSFKAISVLVQALQIIIDLKKPGFGLVPLLHIGVDQMVVLKKGYIALEGFGFNVKLVGQIGLAYLKPLEALGWRVHAKNLYNDFVYFWRWALWKVFENKGGPGIVSFITAASYLQGPGFAGMRQVMRETFDDLWIIDLKGDNLGARKTENVFAIQTPVAIAVGVRYGDGQKLRDKLWFGRCRW